MGFRFKMVQLNVKSLTIVFLAQLSLLLKLTTNTGAYVALKIDKRVIQLPFFEKSEVTGFRDPSDPVGPAIAIGNVNPTQLSVSMDKRSRLLLYVRRERSRVKISTAQKENADDERQTACVNYGESTNRSTLRSDRNILEEILDTKINSPTSQVSSLLSLPHTVSPTLDPFRVPIEWLRVQDAGSRGRGLFALHAIEINSMLGEYMGEVLSQRQYSARYPKGDSDYTFLLSEEAQRRDRIYVDAADESKSNIFR
jgi:hypothetical protein